MEKPVTIKQNEESPVATEILADAIVTVSRGMKKLMAASVMRTNGIVAPRT